MKCNFECMGFCVSAREVKCQLENQLSLDGDLVVYVKWSYHCSLHWLWTVTSSSAERQTADMCDNLGSDSCLGR